MYMCVMGVDFGRFYDYTCNWILKLSYGMKILFFSFYYQRNSCHIKYKIKLNVLMTAVM